MTLAEFHLLVTLSDAGQSLAGIWACVPACAARLGTTVENVWGMDVIAGLEDLAATIPDVVNVANAADYQKAMEFTAQAFSAENLKDTA